jgi:hypothetical protein
MAVIGFWRGDPVLFVGGLRLDQWLDVLVVAFGLAGFIAASRRLIPGRNASL